MDVVEFRPSPDQYAWTFGGVAPTHRIAPGTLLRLWTEHAFSGRLTSTSDRPSAVLDMTQVNPQTGPFFVEGAEPGDTLALHLVDLSPARDWGASTTIPFFGALTGTDRTALLHEPLPERTWIYELDRARGTVGFVARSVDLRLELPCAPMLGTVGVAPPGREVRSSLVPDTFGQYNFGPGVAAHRERDPLRRGRVLPTPRGRVAVEPDGDDRVARRALRPRPARRLLAAHPGRRVAAGQRRRRELQRRHQGREEPAAAGDRLRGRARPAARPQPELDLTQNSI